jgi:hypothetical protein
VVHAKLLPGLPDSERTAFRIAGARETERSAFRIGVRAAPPKVGKLTHQDIGQMESYVRMFDAHARPEGDNPTIGLLLCSRKNEAIAKYSVLSETRQIFAAKYVKVLPTERELSREIERERRLVDARHSGAET